MRALSLLVLGSFSQAAYALPDRHFVEWFPAYAPLFQNIARDNCSVEVDRYWQGHSPFCPSHAEFPQCISSGAVACIMEHATEFHKANLAAAGVILGILPTILSLAGTSTAESGLLALRRPVLAIMLVTGAPVVSPIRSFDFANPARVLAGDHGETVMSMMNLRGSWAFLIVCVEYLLAIAATANLVLASYELGVKGVSSFSTDTVFQPLLWALLAVPIHMIGAAAVRLRLHIVDEDMPARSSRLWFFKQEFTLCLVQPKAILKLKRKTLWFVLLSWLTSIGTLVHMIYGTLVLSSTLFVATVDALGLATRFLASTIVCRAIVAFEISGMADRIRTEQPAIRGEYVAVGDDQKAHELQEIRRM